MKENCLRKSKWQGSGKEPDVGSISSVKQQLANIWHGWAPIWRFSFLERVDKSRVSQTIEFVTLMTTSVPIKKYIHCFKWHLICFRSSLLACSSIPTLYQLWHSVPFKNQKSNTWNIIETTPEFCWTFTKSLGTLFHMILGSFFYKGGNRGHSVMAHAERVISISAAVYNIILKKSKHVWQFVENVLAVCELWADYTLK